MYWTVICRECFDGIPAWQGVGLDGPYGLFQLCESRILCMAISKLIMCLPCLTRFSKLRIYLYVHWCSDACSNTISSPLSPSTSLTFLI